MSKLNCPHCGKPGISVMRKMCLQMAEVAVSKGVWAELLSRIDRLRWMTA